MLVLAAAMIGGGLWLLYEQITVSRIIYGRALFGSAVLITVGLALIWEDFIAPTFKPKR